MFSLDRRSVGGAMAVGLAFALLPLTAGAGSAQAAGPTAAGTAASRSAARLAPLAQPRFAARKVLVGKTAKGRRIVARRTGSATAPIVVLVIGQMHGSEYGGVAVTNGLAARTDVPADVQLWTIATMNPDGYASGNRYNSRGVDLNRNFPVTWSRANRGGRRPASELETQAMMSFISALAPNGTIMFHQPWNEVLSTCDPVAAPWSFRFSDLSGVPVNRHPFCGGSVGIYTGTMGAWFRSVFPVATKKWFVTVELASGSSKKLRRVLATEQARSISAVITISNDLVAGARKAG
ncbi:MAG: DUF2817 domain-containing protein [Actinomycetes bacterium]